MKLPFHYQFSVAPFFVVILLAGLVGYILVELSNINSENETEWQRINLTDNLQATITTALHLKKIIRHISSSTAQGNELDEQYYSYQETSRTLSNNLSEPYFLSQIPIELKRQIETINPLLLDQEQNNINVVRDTIKTLLPDLNNQLNIFLTRKRTAALENNHNLIAVSSRIKIVLITTLILCIFLGIGLTLWGLKVTRRRLKELTDRAYSVCSADEQLSPSKETLWDELEDLDACLTNMTQRLFHVVTVENTLRGTEGARRRIAKDMNDSVLTELNTINKTIGNLYEQCNDDTTIRERLNFLRKNVNEVINHLRRTIDDLYPQVLFSHGLELALHSYMNRNATSTDTLKYHFKFDQNIDSSLSKENKLHLFRIITEAIHNVVTHSHCSQFSVDLHINSKKLVVTVEDNGIGMDKNKDNKGHGCANITERATLLGATVHWRRSQFVNGTCFELIMPMS